MLIRTRLAGYTSGGQQIASGDYLALFKKISGGELFAAVRYVRMEQLGHFMMGLFRIGGQTLSVSGPGGSDGLPIDLVTHPVDMKFLTLVPKDLTHDYWMDRTGWNDLGAMTPRFRTWGRETFPPTKRMRNNR